MTTVSFRMIPSPRRINCKSTWWTLIGFPTWQTLSGNGPCPAGRQAPPELHQDHFWKKAQDPAKFTFWTQNGGGWMMIFFFNWSDFWVNHVNFQGFIITKEIKQRRKNKNIHPKTFSLTWCLPIFVCRSLKMQHPSFLILAHLSPYAPQIRLVRCLCCQLMQTLGALTKKPLKKESRNHGGTLDGWNPAPVFFDSLSHSLRRVLYIPGGCLGFLNHQQ